MKAILVIDIPKEYELDQLAVNYMLYSIEGKILDGDMGIELKSMPEYVRNKNTFAIENKYMNYQDGYNACIDEILGGDNE